MAASSYSWENVSYYDLTFRKLMHERPNRNWSKLYNQVWNLAMCDPINKSTPNQNKQFSSQSQNQTNWRDRCCWRYNRGENVESGIVDLTIDAPNVVLGGTVQLIVINLAVKLMEILMVLKREVFLLRVQRRMDTNILRVNNFIFQF